MHPATRAHINGNLNIIRACMAQIEAALAAEELGHATALQTRDLREDAARDGSSQIYLDDEADKQLETGVAKIFDEMKADVDEQQEFSPAN